MVDDMGLSNYCEFGVPQTQGIDVMRCDAMRCDAMRCDAMRCDAMRCDAIRCGLVTIPA